LTQGKIIFRLKAIQKDGFIQQIVIRKNIESGSVKFIAKDLKVNY